MSRDWIVLLVGSNDQTTETARSLVAQRLESRGFRPHVWDVNPEVRAGVSTEASCIESVKAAHVVVAFITDRPGTELTLGRPDILDDDSVASLREVRILPPLNSNAQMPTVMHVEILAARAYRRPLIMFIDSSTMRVLSRIREALMENQANITPAIENPEDFRTLVSEGRWEDLAFQYTSKHLVEGIPYSHAIFLLRATREGPDNWVENVSFAPKEQDRLLHRLESRMTQVPRSLMSQRTLTKARELDASVGKLEAELGRARGPLEPQSLRLLIQQAALIEPPFEIGNVQRSEPLDEFLRREFGSGRRILVVGPPGIGKSVWCLIAADQLRSDESLRIVFSRWRESSPGEEILQAAIGGEWGRDPWPLAIPDDKWRLIIDGLDESTRHPQESLTALTNFLHSTAIGVLTSVRDGEYRRIFKWANEYFDHVVTLRHWEEEQIRQYIVKLRERDLSRGADYLTRSLLEKSDFLRYPLWLSMLSYLAQNSPRLDLTRLDSDFDLLNACGGVVAELECPRHGLQRSDAPILQQAWSRAAFELRRVGTPMPLENLARLIDLPKQDDWTEAFIAMLDISHNGRVLGFFHEVFQEYWFAKYVAAVVSRGKPDEIADVFGIWRSRFTNRLLRGELAGSGDAKLAAQALRTTYDSSPPSEMTRNQLLYLIGRIDDSVDTQRFLERVWEQEADSPFVRYSAGFAGAIAGSSSLESKLAKEIDIDGPLDEMNRGYHRVYWGDMGAIDERSLPQPDTPEGGIEETAAALIRRLEETDSANLRVRRIELVTLRRLVETHSVPNSFDIGALDEDRLVPFSNPFPDRPDFMEELRVEVERLVSAVR